MYHAKECLRLCLENNLGNFDLAFAYEALARAYSHTKESILVEKYLEKARKTSEKIDNDENRKYLLDELSTIQG